MRKDESHEDKSALDESIVIDLVTNTAESTHEILDTSSISSLLQKYVDQ